ncbi:MAG: efflux RND transporter permease subunit [Candidatus Kapabacteria bacterium]|nr:efflux RND transporter permease subunit [Candidatus Kapabacteria bacterium]
MFLVKVSIKRPVMMTMIIAALLLFGVIAYNNMPMNSMPDVEIPYVTIQTVYGGAGPKEIEGQITKKIEDAVSTVSEIEKITSYSLDGVSIVLIEFKLTKSVDVANQEVKNKVDAIINDLPDDANDPIVEKIDINSFAILDILLTGDQSPKELYEVADKTLKDRFSQIQGVAKVNITGGQKREIHISMDNRTAFEDGISLPSLLSTLANQNYDIPGGYFQNQNQDLTVRFTSKFRTLDEIRNLQVATPFGAKKISQFAEVTDAGEKIRQSATYFDNRTKVKNDNVVRLAIVKASDGNVVKVAEEVIAQLPEIQASLPAGMHLDLAYDGSKFVKDSLSDLMSNLELGILFTAIVLFLFLFDWRSTFIIALSMPTSIIITFLLMSAAGLSKNSLSLMGISSCVGVLVANSVVVIENIFRHKELGLNTTQASYFGTTEVVTAVVASTLTNICVFLPIASMDSMVGRMMSEMALAACFSSVLSIFTSFTLTPMLANLILPEKITKNRMTDFANSMEDKMKKVYSWSLELVLKNKITSAVTIAASIALFVFVMMVFGSKLGFELSPTTDNGKITITAELPVEYNLDQTRALVGEVERRLTSRHPEIKYLLTDLGKKADTDIGTNMAKIDVDLCDRKDRDHAIMYYVGEFIKELADIPSAKFNVSTVSLFGGGGENYPIDFYVVGQETDKLEKYKYEVINKLRGVKGLINFDNSSRSGKPEITIRPKRDVLNEVGLTASTLALTLRASMEGMEATQFTEDGEDYEINIMFDNVSTDTPEKIGNISVIAPNGVSYRMNQLANISFTNGFTKILHDDKFTAIRFTGANSPDVAVSDVTNEINKRMSEIEFEPGYKFKWGGNTKAMNEMIADMLFAFALSIVLTYILLAAVLESFIQPIYILMTIPLALIGVVLFLYFSKIALGITALLGVIMLVGIVVNNAILILDYTNELVRNRRMSIRDALREGAPTKLKAVIMSTMAIILGMLPMALGIGDSGAEMRMPMGVVSVGGLVFSTIFTLWIIPAFYYFFARNKQQKPPIDDAVFEKPNYEN